MRTRSWVLSIAAACCLIPRAARATHYPNGNWVVGGGAPMPRNSTLNANCLHAGDACGQCEGNMLGEIDQLMADSLQSPANGQADDAIKPGVTLESFLSRVTDIMRRNNQGAPGKLNYMVVGDSQSTQPTRPGYERVLLKSPNSEFWISFVDDPQSPSYNKLEIMRWNGAQGKYVFQELDFGGGADHPAHADLSGKTCVRCHKSPNPRPNWDTYRSWAGVIPPRDDYLEVEPRPDGYDGFTDDQKSQVKSGQIHPKPDAPAMQYFDFMRKVRDARSSAAPSRLRLLDIPYDGSPGATDDAKIAAIQQQMNANGFYHIPHFPTREHNLNFSQKTASQAGPSHVAFDQLMGQQMCQVAHSLEENPDWQKFKYAVAGMLFCTGNHKANVSQSELNDFLPAWVQGRANAFFNSNPSWRTKTSAAPAAAGPASGTADVISEVYRDTQANHSVRDEYKMQREEAYVRGYMKTVKNASDADANAEARSVARDAHSGVGAPYSAIRDPGGVRGVAESDPGTISALRYILEPLGVPVANWSMTVGKEPGDSSFAFSDQFGDIMREQIPIQKVFFEEAQGNCERLKQLSRGAWGQPPAAPPPPAVPADNALASCRKLQESVSVPGLSDAAAALDRDLGPQARELANDCAACHVGGKHGFDFPSGESALRAWLGSQAPRRSESGAAMTWLEEAEAALSARHSSVTPPIAYQMPPGGLDPDPAKDALKRQLLLGYLRALSQSKGSAQVSINCRMLTAGSTKGGGDSAAPPANGAPGAAPANVSPSTGEQR